MTSEFRGRLYQALKQGQSVVILERAEGQTIILVKKLGNFQKEFYAIKVTGWDITEAMTFNQISPTMLEPHLKTLIELSFSINHKYLILTKGEDTTEPYPPILQ